MTRTATGEWVRDMSGQRASSVVFGITVALLIAASWILTIRSCGTMSAMGEAPMPGGWSMSMVWIRMPGQSWFGAGIAFVGMWIVMMAAMMLPSFVPVLWRYGRAATSAGERHTASLVALVGLGYFVVWAAIGVAVFTGGAAFAVLAMRHSALSRAVPLVSVCAAGIAIVVQLVAWHARGAASCVETPVSGCPRSARARNAWRHGLRLGAYCGQCCAGLMMLQLIVGIMGLRTMAVVAAVVAAERLAREYGRAGA
jgi:predicted metal-binding membrane protein